MSANLIELRQKFEALCCRRWGGDREALTLREDGVYAMGPIQFAWEAFQAATEQEQKEPTTGHWISAEDYYRNVKALNVALNGEGGATRPLLIDVLGQVEIEARRLGMPVLKALAQAEAQPKQEPVAHFGSAYVNENGVHITTVLGPVAIPQDAELYLATQPAAPAVPDAKHKLVKAGLTGGNLRRLFLELEPIESVYGEDEVLSWWKHYAAKVRAMLAAAPEVKP